MVFININNIININIKGDVFMMNDGRMRISTVRNTGNGNVRIEQPQNQSGGFQKVKTLSSAARREELEKIRRREESERQWQLDIINAYRR
jgi:hypothetical protein